MLEGTVKRSAEDPSAVARASAQGVRRRKVFYVPGYDPFPPRRYRELYRTEAAVQSEISGHQIAVRPAHRTGWQVTATVEGQHVDASVEVLVWSDIVQSSMGQGIFATYVQLVSTSWTYLSSRALFRLMLLRKGPVIAALYPIVVLLVQAIVACALGALSASIAGRLIANEIARTIIMCAAFTGTALLTVHLARRYDRKIYAWYLMHDYAFTACEGGAYPRVLEDRIAEFVTKIRLALQGDWDEVLVVGHSSGVHLAISALADLYRLPLVPDGKLGFLSLGHVVPMVSFLPNAERLRTDLACLSNESRLTWVDVSAPGDGCAFALCDPVSVSGMASTGKLWPLVLSAAFTQTLSAERWNRLRWKFFRLHFQYLCAFDRPGDYDYFAITAGPRTLGARFANRAPSQSRIERPVNPFGLVQ